MLLGEETPPAFKKGEGMERIKIIADFYGFRHQCLKCLEEMAELSVEITKYLENEGPTYTLEQELADVIIMTEQLRYLTGTFVDLEIDRKLERQIRRIEHDSKGTDVIFHKNV